MRQVPLEQALSRACAASDCLASVVVLGAGCPRPVVALQLRESAVASGAARRATADTIIAAILALNETLPPFSRLDWRQVRWHGF